MACHIAFGQHKRSNDVGRGMPSSPLGSTHGRTTSGVACHNHLKAAHLVERSRAWHEITAFRQHTRLIDVGGGMLSSPMGSTHGRTTSGVACHYSPWMANTVELCQALHAINAFGEHTWSNDVGRGMPSSPLGSTNGQTMSGLTCHHCLWTAHTVE